MDRERTWKEEGACYGSFSDVFFPENYGGKMAREICNTCGVVEECLEYAVETNQKHGVWGGKTRSQRLRIRYGRDA